MTREELRAWRVFKDQYEQVVHAVASADRLRDAELREEALRQLNEWTQRELDRLREPRAKMILLGGRRIILGIVNRGGE